MAQEKQVVFESILTGFQPFGYKKKVLPCNEYIKESENAKNGTKVLIRTANRKLYLDYAILHSVQPGSFKHIIH